MTSFNDGIREKHHSGIVSIDSPVIIVIIDESFEPSYWRGISLSLISRHLLLLSVAGVLRLSLP